MSLSPHRMSYQTQTAGPLAARRAAVSAPPVATPTSLLERLLLVAGFVLLPLQNYLPTLGGSSVMFFYFGAAGVYLFLNRYQSLSRAACHPVFLVAFALLAWAAMLEMLHPMSDYFELARLFQMVVAGVFTAALCRDRKALSAALLGAVAAALWVSVYLILSNYGTLTSVKVESFAEASEVRGELFDDSVDSPNTLALYTAQGVVVAAAVALGSRAFWFRFAALLVGGFCLVANFINMSRGGLVILAAGCFVLLLKRGFNLRILGLGAAVGLAMLVFVPDAAFHRLTIWSEDSDSVAGIEGREQVYTAAVETIPQYFWLGVGSGNFWNGWGLDTSFNKGGMVMGSHNGLFQVTIYWGIGGLLILLLVLLLALKSLPARVSEDPLALAVYGLAAALLVFLQVHHVLSAKQFSLGLGVIVGSHLWIWHARRDRGVRGPA